MIITLIGYRGCGKSSVGPLLAERLNCRCIDSDDVIEKRAARSIADIFATDGEPKFRQLETEVLTDLVQTAPPLVIAAGGGAVLAEANRKLMTNAGPVVWLKASAETLANRISSDESSGARRPSLTGQSVTDEVAGILAKRIPLYRDTATLIVDAETHSPSVIAERIYRSVTGEPVGEAT